MTVSVKLCVIYHVFYEKLFNKYLKYLHNINIKFDLYVNFSSKIEDIDKIRNKIKQLKYLNNVLFVYSKNIGFDAGGIVNTLNEIIKKKQKYEYMLLIHTKSGNNTDFNYDNKPEKNDIDLWIKQLYHPILGNTSIFENVMKNFEKKNIGMICGNRMKIETYDFTSKNNELVSNPNKIHLEYFLKRLGIEKNNNDDYAFICGTVFFIRWEIMEFIIINGNFDQKSLLDLDLEKYKKMYNLNLTDDETVNHYFNIGYYENSLILPNIKEFKAHGFERLYGIITEHLNYDILSINTEIKPSLYTKKKIYKLRFSKHLYRDYN